MLVVIIYICFDPTLSWPNMRKRKEKSDVGRYVKYIHHVSTPKFKFRLAIADELNK